MQTFYTTLQDYFTKYKEGVIGNDRTINTPYGDQIPLIYADWTASGRAYLPIEQKFMDEIFPLLANTHTDTNYTGSAMTYALHKAKEMIKHHVGAGPEDVIISSDAGMTGVVNKLQRILGIKLHESFKGKIHLGDKNRPVVFVTHMEHHSNQTSWLETISDVIVIPPDVEGMPDQHELENLLQQYQDRPMRIGAFTSCSNVTGILTPYMDYAALMHRYGGYCFVDFACSAPYIDIVMHEDQAKGRYLDALYFSPHKFLGGPGSTGILVFNKSLYRNKIPDNPGGGTVTFTNPWGVHSYFDDIEAREEGGTPPFLQTIRAAMCIRLKEEMGTAEIRQREEEILSILWPMLDSIPNLHILADQHRHRLGVVSFYIDGLHYNLGVKLLNDRYGIQTRGGCSCAGTYGHYLLNINAEKSGIISEKILSGDCSLKPGWIRLSIHPTNTDEEIRFIGNAIKAIAENFQEWGKDYNLNYETNLVYHKNETSSDQLYRTIDHILSEDFV
jgi:selenocysteine lyase/cysteine desulfurase